jgi:hypothetical protein
MVRRRSLAHRAEMSRNHLCLPFKIKRDAEDGLPRAAIFQRLTQYKPSALAPLTWDYLRLMSTPNHRAPLRASAGFEVGVRAAKGDQKSN